MAKKLDSKRNIAGTDRTVCDYWAWAFSDVLGNTEIGISKTRSWNPENNSLPEHVTRESDIYVFASTPKRTRQRRTRLM